MQTLFRKRTWWLVGAMVAVVALMAAACGDDDDDDDGDGGNGSDFDYGALDGNLDIDGSSTVFPITQAVAEEFQSVAGNVETTVGFVGTGGGAEKFCRGEIQLWDASRPARESDLEAGCNSAGVSAIGDLLEFQVGIDALTVVVNPENDWATCMTVDQLNLAFKSGGAAKWSDIDPSWPDEDIVFYYPGTDSGTYDYFVEVVIGEDADHRTDGTSSEDDNVLALGVEEDENAIGYFGFAYYQEAGDELKALEVDDGEGCVEPSFDNALSGDYAPLSRPLFIYSSEQILQESPQAVGFLNFLFENIDLVADVGYITLPDDELEAQVAKLDPYLQ
jgi:phosphate transport system substrate-binding protein